MKYRHRVLGFFCLLATITYLDRVAISVAGPRMQEGLHISPEAWGWVVGIFTVSYALFTIATILTANKFATLFALGLVYAGITLQQTVLAAVIIDVGRKYVGGIYGAINMVGNVGGFLFSVSFGYFVKWFGSYDLALIPVSLMLVVAALAWLRVDATEEIIPERPPVAVPEGVVPAWS